MMKLSILENDNMEPPKVVCVVDGISFFVGDVFRFFFAMNIFRSAFLAGFLMRNSQTNPQTPFEWINPGHLFRYPKHKVFW